ncbi:gap junction delta-4 protein isoform X1 [Canis lupus familiaris]|uniref:gap junction delta-4 protein isoform X1 n=1 Tax=Canis lupus familiaris TaxID=9615 RepID=UPI0018F7D8AD|nr:gap junction delta-4 protein isoform X1 [Canis lupus familiaris]
MERLDLLGFLLITFNCNVTIVGKIWLIFAILLRMVVLLSAGAPVYQDEQERFVCNTLQPGCANVCYDAFSPVSQLRFWLLQSLAALLPSALFCAYVLHRGAALAARGLGLGGRDAGGPRDLPVPDLSRGYVVHLSLRVLTEAAFGASHYLLFGLAVPARVPCAQPPCSGVVDCYVSRPTEKALLALLMGAASALSLLLSAADLLCSVRGASPGLRAGLRAGAGAGRPRRGAPGGPTPTPTAGLRPGPATRRPPVAWSRAAGCTDAPHASPGGSGPPTRCPAPGAQSRSGCEDRVDAGARRRRRAGAGRAGRPHGAAPGAVALGARDPSDTDLAQRASPDDPVLWARRPGARRLRGRPAGPGPGVRRAASAGPGGESPRGALAWGCPPACRQWRGARFTPPLPLMKSMVTELSRHTAHLTAS